MARSEIAWEPAKAKARELAGVLRLQVAGPDAVARAPAKKPMPQTKPEIVAWLTSNGLEDLVPVYERELIMDADGFATITSVEEAELKLLLTGAKPESLVRLWGKFVEEGWVVPTERGGARAHVRRGVGAGGIC